MKIPYGFDALRRHLDEDPWVNLKTIDEFLQDGEAVPPGLAAWLGLAIRYSNGDPDELLRRLQLKDPRGRKPSTHKRDAWLEWGARVCQLEDEGKKKEAALAAVMDEYAELNPQGVSRTQLQKWRSEFLEASDDARASN